LILTTVALLARTVATLATGSVAVYFIQPTAATCLVGAAFLLSVPLKRPLVGRLALDFVPLDDATRSHPTVRRFFSQLSLWWGRTSMVNFAITLWLLLTASPTTFVLFRALMTRSGTSVVFAPASRSLVPSPA